MTPADYVMHLVLSVFLIIGVYQFYFWCQRHPLAAPREFHLAVDDWIPLVDAISVFVPPNRWFHQHFNVSEHDDRYLAFHAPRGGGGNERVEDRARDQIEYPDEDPFVRDYYKQRLAEEGVDVTMPDALWDGMSRTS